MTSCRRLCNRFSPSCITSASSHFWRSSLRSSCFDFSTRFLEIDDVIGAFAGYMIVAVLWGNLYS